jgi:bifunctional UDP-N-acetylglucosamine pyrophosphorylase/glucosamine-1-phosphate N-acetyltransferase
MSRSLAAIVLCAGQGTRMKSERAKVLHPLLGRPMCAYPIARALEIGASPLVVVVGYQAEEVKNEVKANFPGQPLRFAVQDIQRGTAHAVQCASKELEGHTGPILILYGDTPLLRCETLARLVEAYQKAPAPLALVTSRASDPSGYGRVVRSRGKISRVVEQRDCAPQQLKIKECNAGIYLVNSSFLWKALARTEASNAQREFYLTDLVAQAASRGKVPSVEADLAETAGVNDREELARSASVIRERINSRQMRAGVTLLDPASTTIEDRVEIGNDSEVGPGVSLVGVCRIGKGVRIGQGSVVMDSDVGDGTEIRPYSVLESARVATGCILGPFCRLRPGTELAESVHLGNFVETKKAVIGKGTKANHLSYLGDALIGAGVNVGAGTITCNYDGVDKHQTVLEDGVFVGSDTQLVAPVKVGKGSYIGAGTTVTEDVPPMSLTLSRSPQLIKEGWVQKKKSGGRSASQATRKAGAR